MLKAFVQVDLFAALVALVWSISASFVPEMASLCSPEISFGFALVAAARGARKAALALDAGK